MSISYWLILVLFFDYSLGFLLSSLPVDDAHYYKLKSQLQVTKTDFQKRIGKSTGKVLVTFDLDDTLFPISPVVKDSNGALINYLREKLNCSNVTEEGFSSSMKDIRNRSKENEEGPMTYTELRCRTIAHELKKKENYNNSDDIDTCVLKAYEVWEKERHASAERHLYKTTIPMLKCLKQRNFLIGAITNGKGNPFCMEHTLKPFFDFCVSGEDSNVFPRRKPDPGIYEIALQPYDDIICWFHVGDDLANDIGASSVCGAKAIWAKLNDDPYQQTARKRTDEIIDSTTQGQPSWSTLSPSELQMRKEKNNAARNFISAEIECLLNLPGTIDSLLQNNA